MGVKINKKLVPMKAHYFLFNAGTGPVVPFMPTLIKQIGFSPVVVGTIYLVLPISGLIAKPLFGAIADRFHRQKLFFVAFQVLVAIAFFSMNFIPPIQREAPVHLDCNDNVAVLKFCDKNDTFNQCLVDQLINNDSSNDSMSCRTKCHVDPKQWDAACHNWNLKPDCTKPDDSIPFEALSPMKHINYIDSNGTGCMFFRISTVEFENGINSSLSCPPGRNITGLTCNTSCSDPLVMETIAPNISDDEAYGLYQFWLIFLFLIASWVGMAVVVSVGDAICFELLGDKPQLYGNQRLWGAVGWGMFSFLAGFLVDRASTGQSDKNYSIVFYMVLVLMLLDALISSKLKHVQTKLSQNILKDIGPMFASPKIVVFFIWCIFVGLGTAMIWQFLFWHLEDLAGTQDDCNSMDWIKTLQGLVMGIQCFGGELPFFFLSGRILKRIGHVNAMTLVLFAFGVRFLLYSLLRNPWYVLPIEFLNGVTFGLFYATMASYASIVAPPGTEATIQGLVGAIFEGIGVSSGSLIGGILMNKYGGSITFRYFGTAALAASVVHYVAQYFLRKSESGHQKIYELDEKMIGTNENVTSGQ